MEKYIDTPAGKFPIPKGITERFDKMSDIEILEEYKNTCIDLIEPFLFQEMKDRNLVFRGEYRQDILNRLEQLKSGGASK